MTFSVAGVEKSKTEDEVRPVLSKAAEKSQKSQVPLYQVGKMTKQGRGLPPPRSLAVRGLVWRKWKLFRGEKLPNAPER